MNKRIFTIFASVLISLLIVLSASCEEKEFELSVKTHKDSELCGDDILFSASRHVYGFNPVTMDLKLHLELNTYVSQPVMNDDGSFYLGDQGQDIGYFGNWIFAFTNRGELKKQAAAIPNIDKIINLPEAVVASSMCLFGEKMKMGYTVIDKDNMSREVLNTNLDSFIPHSGDQWTFGNKIYIFTSANNYSEVPAPVKFFTIDTGDFSESEKTEDFVDGTLSQKMFAYTLCDDKIITSYGTEFVVEKYDIATKTLTGRINLGDYVPELRKALDEQTEEEKALGVIDYCTADPTVCDGMLYLFCKKYESDDESLFMQSMIVIDMSSFTFKKIINLEKAGEYGQNDLFFMNKSCPDALFFYEDTVKYCDVFKYSTDNGKLVNSLRINK